MKRILIATFAWSALLFTAGSMLFVGHTQSPSAPTEDHVGFPTGYKDNFKRLFAFDNWQNRQVRVIWANSIATSVDPVLPINFPYGSVLLFEDFPVEMDANGDPILDSNGRFIAQDLRTIFAMRKERGFGAEYGDLRNGEWEYVSYLPDGNYATPPSGSATCAACHMNGGGTPVPAGGRHMNAQNDYVFRTDLFFGNGNGALPKGLIQNYSFVPNTIHVQAGETFTLYNDDQLMHNIVADDGSFASPILTRGGSYTLKAGDAGTVISFHCSLHSRMRGKIVVDAPAGQ